MQSRVDARGAARHHSADLSRPESRSSGSALRVKYDAQRVLLTGRREKPCGIRSGNDAWFRPTRPLLDAGDFVGDDNEVGERFLRFEVVAVGVRFVAFDIDAQRRT